MSRSSGVDNAVWEEEQVNRMLDLAGDEEDDADESSDDAPAAARERAAPSPAGAGRDAGGGTGGPSTSRPPDDQEEDSDRWSDITDPFEEFHRRGALQTEEAVAAPTQQPPCSRRSQFLRAVSLFSPAHQLAVLEVRDEQGVSLLERSTSLTAEPLDLAVTLDGVVTLAPLARSLSLPAGTLQPELAAVAGAPHSPHQPQHSLRALGARSRSSRSTRSCSLCTEPPGPGVRGVRGPARVTYAAARPTGPPRRRSSTSGTLSRASAPSSGKGGGARTPPRTPRSRSGSGTGATASDAAEGGAGTEARRGSRDTSFLDVDPNADPTLVALLRSLWLDPPRSETSPRPDAGTISTKTRDRDRDRDRDQEPDVLSGLWRMLDCYDDFKCSPPGFHAFRQDKPHWLDQEPIPWAVREAAREKCSRWLQTCPGYPTERERESWADGHFENRRRSELEQPGRPGPPPPRSLTSTPALADHVPAITAVRKLKQFKSLRP